MKKLNVAPRKYKLKMRCGYSSGRHRSHDAVACPFCGGIVELYWNVTTKKKCGGCGALHDWETGTATKNP